MTGDLRQKVADVSHIRCNFREKSLQLAFILRLYDVAQFVGQNHDKRFAQIRGPD